MTGHKEQICLGPDQLWGDCGEEGVHGGGRSMMGRDANGKKKRTNLMKVPFFPESIFLYWLPLTNLI